MAGTTANATQWGEADVFVADLGSTGPSDTWTAWGVDWDAVGLLSGEDGFAEAQEEDSEDFYAWGSILVGKTKSKHKRTIKFVTMEDPIDNPTIHRLVNPGSVTVTTDGDGVRTSVVKVPGRDAFAIGFETRDGTETKRRIVAKAEVQEIGEIVDSEEGYTLREITVVIYPATDGTLYTDLKGPSTDPGSS
jgi:hypothetical protein